MKPVTIAHILFLAGACALLHAAPAAAEAETATHAPGKIVVSGTVPDETTKAALISRLQALYGSGRVVDQISVGGVMAPTGWSRQVSRLLNDRLKEVRKGLLTIEGHNVALRGEVDSDNLRHSLPSDLTGTLDQSYTLRHNLRVVAPSQLVLDQAIGQRVIEFENGSAMLTESGKRVLEEILLALQGVPTSRIDIIGHTDDTGKRPLNIALSMARAESVKLYLVARGLAAQTISTSGMGPDQPLHSNASEEGRRRNRRIEFRVSQ